MSAVN
jgi:hypothetical protein